MKNEINRLFDKITPIRSDEQIISAVIGKAENMNTNETRKCGFKKPAVIACAAALTLCVGATAVAVIDFDELFNGGMVSDGTLIAEEYLADISNFRATSSDDAYTLQLMGVTGTADNIYGSFEITRTDGTPVTEHFYNADVDSDLDCNKWWSWLVDESKPAGVDDSMEHYLDFKINENGNIDGFFGLRAQDMDAAGKTVKVQFENVWVEDTDNCFPIMMGFQLDYTPPEGADAVREIDISEGAAVYCENERGYPNVATKADITDSRINFFYGYITLEYETKNFSFGDMEMTVIKNDGTEVPTHFRSSSYIYNNDGTCSECFFFEYREYFDEPLIAVDPAEIKAVRLNGVEFSLK